MAASQGQIDSTEFMQMMEDFQLVPRYITRVDMLNIFKEANRGCVVPAIHCSRGGLVP